MNEDLETPPATGGVISTPVAINEDGCIVPTGTPVRLEAGHTYEVRIGPNLTALREILRP